MFKKIKKRYSDYMLNKAIKKYTKYILNDNDNDNDNIISIVNEWSEEMGRLSKEIEKIGDENVSPVMNDFFLDIIDIKNDDKKLFPDFQSRINKEIRRCLKR